MLMNKFIVSQLFSCINKKEVKYMTLVEAYYIFYQERPIDKIRDYFSSVYGERIANEYLKNRSIEELLKVYLEATKTKEIIRKEYRNLSKQYHPDINSGDKTQEERMKLVNAAKDYFDKNLTFVNINTPYQSTTPQKPKKNNESKVIYRLAMSKEASEIEELIPAFLRIADYAKRLREYKTTSALYKNASFFNEELDKTYLPTELYTLYTEYVNFYNDTKNELRKINEDYIELKKLVATGCLDGKKLYQAISKLAGPYIDNLSDNIFLKIELAYWENQEQEEKAKEFRDNDSHIRNTRVVLSRLLNNSDKLNQIICYKCLKDKSTSTLEELSSMNSLKNKVEVHKKYVEQASNFIKRINYWHNRVTSLVNAEFNERTIARLEEDLKAIIPESYLHLIAEDKELNKMSRDFQKNRAKYKKNDVLIAASHKKTLVSMQDRTKENNQEISYIDKLFLQYEHRELTATKKSSLKDSPDKEEATINKYYYSGSLLNYCEKQAILLYKKVFTCLAATGFLGRIQVPYASIYGNLPENATPKEIDRYYKVIKANYTSIITEYKNMYHRDFVIDEKVLSTTRKYLIDELNHTFIECYERGAVVPKQLQETINNTIHKTPSILKLLALIEEVSCIGYEEYDLKSKSQKEKPSKPKN